MAGHRRPVPKPRCGGSPDVEEACLPQFWDSHAPDLFMSVKRGWNGKRRTLGIPGLQWARGLGSCTWLSAAGTEPTWSLKGLPTGDSECPQTRDGPLRKTRPCRENWLPGTVGGSEAFWGKKAGLILLAPWGPPWWQSYTWAVGVAARGPTCLGNKIYSSGHLSYFLILLFYGGIVCSKNVS